MKSSSLLRQRPPYRSTSSGKMSLASAASASWGLLVFLAVVANNGGAVGVVEAVPLMTPSVVGVTTPSPAPLASSSSSSSDMLVSTQTTGHMSLQEYRVATLQCTVPSSSSLSSSSLSSSSLSSSSWSWAPNPTTTTTSGGSNGQGGGGGGPWSSAPLDVRMDVKGDGHFVASPRAILLGVPRQVVGAQPASSSSSAAVVVVQLQVGIADDSPCWQSLPLPPQQQQQGSSSSPLTKTPQLGGSSSSSKDGCNVQVVGATTCTLIPLTDTSPVHVTVTELEMETEMETETEVEVEAPTPTTTPAKGAAAASSADHIMIEEDDAVVVLDKQVDITLANGAHVVRHDTEHVETYLSEQTVEPSSSSSSLSSSSSSSSSSMSLVRIQRDTSLTALVDAQGQVVQVVGQTQTSVVGLSLGGDESGVNNPSGADVTDVVGGRWEEEDDDDDDQDDDDDEDVENAVLNALLLAWSEQDDTTNDNNTKDTKKEGDDPSQALPCPGKAATNSGGKGQEGAVSTAAATAASMWSQVQTVVASSINTAALFPLIGFTVVGFAILLALKGRRPTLKLHHATTTTAAKAPLLPTTTTKGGDNASSSSSSSFPDEKKKQQSHQQQGQQEPAVASAEEEEEEALWGEAEAPHLVHVVPGGAARSLPPRYALVRSLEEEEEEDEDDDDNNNVNDRQPLHL